MGRVILNLGLVPRRAVAGVLLIAVLLLAGPAAVSQIAGPVETDAERIARLRDQAGQAAEAAEAERGPTPGLPSQIDATPGPAVEQAPLAAEPKQELPKNEMLRLGQGEGELFKGGVSDAATSGGMGDGWLMSTLTALGVVLLLVFGLRWLLRRGGVVTARAPQGSVVEVLSRTTVAPRSHVLLMRIGTRVLIVNDSPNGMRTLAKVEDPEEVAELLGVIDASKPTSMSKSFSGVMSKLSGGWSEAGDGLDDEEAEGLLGTEQAGNRARGAVSSVRGRLAALAGGGIKA